MASNLDETELAQLEELACAAGAGDYSAHEDADANAKYAAAACNSVPALIAEVRRLREKVEAWEWWEEVRTYDTDAFHPYREHKYANPYEDKKAKAYGNAYLEWEEMWHAAREAVHADSE